MRFDTNQHRRDLLHRVNPPLFQPRYALAHVLIDLFSYPSLHNRDWPPPAGLDLLSISGINYISSENDNNKTPDIRWYWSPALATWLFSILIAWFIYRASCDYVDMRQRYFRHPSKELSSRSLLISNVPHEMRSDEKLKTWIEQMKHAVQHPVEQATIGHHSAKLTALTQEDEAAVRHLENALASYLNGMHNNWFPLMLLSPFSACSPSA